MTNTLLREARVAVRAIIAVVARDAVGQAAAEQIVGLVHAESVFTDLAQVWATRAVAAVTGPGAGTMLQEARVVDRAIIAVVAQRGVWLIATRIGVGIDLTAILRKNTREVATRFTEIAVSVGLAVINADVRFADFVPQAIGVSDAIDAPALEALAEVAQWSP